MCFPFWGMAGGWWTVEMTCTCLGDFCWEVQMPKIVELSMCDCPIETVKYMWVNILYMLDWIFSQNCKNSLSFQTAGQLDA